MKIKAKETSSPITQETPTQSNTSASAPMAWPYETNYEGKSAVKPQKPSPKHEVDIRLKGLPIMQAKEEPVSINDYFGAFVKPKKPSIDVRFKKVREWRKEHSKKDYFSISQEPQQPINLQESLIMLAKMMETGLWESEKSFMEEVLPRSPGSFAELYKEDLQKCVEHGNKRLAKIGRQIFPDPHSHPGRCHSLWIDEVMEAEKDVEEDDFEEDDFEEDIEEEDVYEPDNFEEFNRKVRNYNLDRRVFSVGHVVADTDRLVVHKHDLRHASTNPLNKDRKSKHRIVSKPAPNTISTLGEKEDYGTS
jgi:hypothetical protein